MRTLHALLAGSFVALVLGASPAVASPLPSADEAQRLVAQAINARAVTTLVCADNKKNVASKGAADYLRTLGMGRLSYDGTQFLVLRAGERLLTKVQGDWERDRTAVDPQKPAWSKMVAAPEGCWRLPLGLYKIQSVSNVRAGDSDQTALADYTFTVVPTSFGDAMLQGKADSLVDADPLVAVPARPVFLSFYSENATKPLPAQAKLAFVDGSWRVVP
jgi:hypothetical protein